MEGQDEGLMACDHVFEHGHTHSDACGHRMVLHQGHMDYVCDGRLHRPHGEHCDDHGLAALAL